MLTAHLPSGYYLAKAMKTETRLLTAAPILGAVFPDFDMLAFLFFDNGAIHHHRYWVHIPFFWIVVMAVALPLARWLGYMRIAVTFFVGVFLHLLLDSIAGGIMWLAPYDDTLYELVTVPAAYSNWVMSFVFHWTFLLEIAVWIAAITLYFQSCRPVMQPE